MDDSIEQLKRLAAFVGLKIVKIEVNDYDIVLIMKFHKKFFKLVIEDGEISLVDSKFEEVSRVKNKLGKKNYQPIQIVYPSQPNYVPTDITTGTWPIPQTQIWCSDNTKVEVT